MSMNHNSGNDTISCYKCGYTGKGFILRCPQCRQIELMEKQVNGGSSSSSSSGMGWLIIILIGIAVVNWIIELIKSFFAWLINLFYVVWGFVTYPFKKIYTFMVVDWSWWKVVLAVLLLCVIIEMLTDDKKSK